MARKATTLHDDKGNELLPITNASITYMDDGTSVQAEINELKEKTQYNKGHYNSPEELLLAYPNNIENPLDRKGWYAIVGSTDTMWIWDIEGNQWANSGSTIGAVESVNGLSGEVILTGGNINATATIGVESQTKLIDSHLTGIYSSLDNKVEQYNNTTGNPTLYGRDQTNKEYQYALIGDRPLAWTILQRNGEGQIVVGEPTSNNNATTKKYVDDIAQTKLNKYISTDGNNYVYGSLWNGEQTNFKINREVAEGYTIVQRNENGEVIVGEPTLNSHATTKKYVDDKINDLDYVTTDELNQKISEVNSNIENYHIIDVGEYIEKSGTYLVKNGVTLSILPSFDIPYETRGDVLLTFDIKYYNNTDVVENVILSGNYKITQETKPNELGLEVTINYIERDDSVPYSSYKFYVEGIYARRSPISTVTLNGESSNRRVSFYAPTRVGTNGQILYSKGSGAPEWRTPNYATEQYVIDNGGKIDTINVNGTPQTISNKTVNITVPTNNNELINGNDYQNSSQVNTAIQNATSGMLTSNNYGQVLDSVYQEKGNYATVSQLNAKQDSLTTTQLEAINSGANATNISQITTNTNNIDTINSKIPSQASSTNQLADKDFVNSSLNSITAFYITSNANGDPFSTKSALTSATTYYSGGQVATPTRNDYAIVLQDETKDNATTRYIYYNQWEYQYTVNETALTADQLSAINSGITSTLVGKISSNELMLNSLAEQVVTDYVPNTRTINNKPLSSNITLNANDVGALPSTTVIPTVNNGTLTIQKNGTTIGTFGANQYNNATINITVPVNNNELTNGANYATEQYVQTNGGKIDTISVNGVQQTITNKNVNIIIPEDSNNYNDLINKPAKFLGILSYDSEEGQTLDSIEALKNLDMQGTDKQCFAIIVEEEKYSDNEYFCVISHIDNFTNIDQVIFNLSTGIMYKRNYTPFSGWTTFEEIRYLTTTGTAYNSNRLNNQDASYYLNYNNFSNRPTIPTDNDQLTNGANYMKKTEFSTRVSSSTPLRFYYNTGAGEVAVELLGQDLSTMGTSNWKARQDSSGNLVFTYE